MIKMLVCDFDGTLDGGASQEVDQFSDYMSQQPDLRFVIATGRTLSSIKAGLTTHRYPKPHSIVSAVGTQIHHHAHDLVIDERWQEQLESKWDKSAVQSVLNGIHFLGQGNDKHQDDYKLTFEGKLDRRQCIEIAETLRQHAVEAEITYSHDWFLDITPKGVNKATAIHYLMQQYNVSPEETCVAGDSGNDTAMLTISGIHSILVANHYQEVAYLSALDHVYTSHATHAQGVLEGLKYWQNLLGE